MKNTSFRARTLACALLASTATCGLTAAPAHAQTADTAPAFRNLDANGVDLTRGDFVLGFVEGSIGSGQGELAIVRRRNGNGASQWDNILLERFQSGGTATVYVNLGVEGEKFIGTATSLTSTKAKGGTLTLGGGGYVYRAADGSTVTFTDPSAQTGGQTNFCTLDTSQSYCRLVPEQVTSPDGKTIALDWNIVQRCRNFFNPDGTIDCDYFWRLSGVSNSHGYGINFAYAAGDTGGSYGQTPASSWYRRTSATFYNRSVSSSPQGNVGYAYPASDVTDVTDMAGRTWRFSGSGGSLTVRRPGATSDSLAYASGSGGVTSVVRDGVTTNYSRTVSGSTATMTVTNALNQQTVVTSDLTIGRPLSIKDALNRTTSFQYDTNGRLTRVTQPEGNYVQMTLDGRGNVTQKQAVAKPGSGAAPITTSASYAADCFNTPSCNQPLTTTDARGNVTNYSYDASHGGLAAVTLPAASNGVRPQTRYGYTLTNGEYQLTSVSACQTSSGASGEAPASCAGAADEVKSTISYDVNGNVTSVSTGSGNGALTASRAMTYDAKGDLISVDGPLAGTADTIRYRYNAARELVGTISADPDGGGALRHRAVRNVIDGSARLARTETGTVLSQSDADWAAFSVLEAVEIGYDAHHRPVTQKLVAGGTAYALTQTSYDALGRVDCTAQRMNPAAYGAALPWACLRTADGSHGPDRITRNTYDAVGRVSKVQSAFDTPEITADVIATFTASGQVETVTDGEGNKTTYEYDGHDRLSKTYYPVAAKGANASNGADYEQLGYDAGGNVVSFRTRANQVIAFSYDALNRLTLKDVPNPTAQERDVSYTYDNLGRMTAAGDWHRHVELTYDALGRVTRQRTPVGWLDMEYDVAGRMTKIAHPAGEFPVVYDYLVTGEVSRIREWGATSGIQVAATFGYDQLGRRTSLTRGNGTVTSYGYDAVSRLSSLSHDLAGTANDLTLTFGYNPASQIVSRTSSNDAYSWTGHGSGTTGSTVNGLNQLTAQGSAALSHDANGNITNDGAKAYGYTSENRMIQAGTASLDYNPLGQLLRAGDDMVDVDYAGDRIVVERNGGNLEQRHYLHGPGVDEPLVWYEGGPYSTDRRYMYADERGSIIALADNGGNLTANNKYDEYGKPQGTVTGRFGYTGQVWLPQVGLYSYKARMYWPAGGRFMQPDPLGYADGMNQYAYVGNDPVNFTDPSGTCGIGEVPMRKYTGAGDSGDVVVAQYRYVCAALPGQGFGGHAGGAGGAGVGGAAASNHCIIRGTCSGSPAMPNPSPKSKPKPCTGMVADVMKNMYKGGDRALDVAELAAVASLLSLATPAAPAAPFFAALASYSTAVGLSFQVISSAYYFRHGNVAPFGKTAVGWALGRMNPLPGKDGAAVWGAATSLKDSKLKPHFCSPE